MLPCQPVGLRASSCSAGTTRLTSPHSSARCASIRLAGEQHLHRALAREVAADRHAGRRAEEAPVDAGASRTSPLSDGHREVALRDELAAGRRRGAVHARDHRLRQRLDGHASCGCTWRTARAIFGCSSSARISFRSCPAQKPLPAAARTTTRMLLVVREAIERCLQRLEHLASSAGSTAAAGSASAWRCRRGPRAAGSTACSSGWRSCEPPRIDRVADFAFSRSTNFWILPVEVFGSSPNTTALAAP